MIEICQYRYKGTQLRLTSRYMEKKLYFFFKSIFKEYVTSLWTPPPPCAQYSHRQLPSGKKTIKTSHGIYTFEKFNNRDAEWLKNRYVDLPVAPSWFITKLVTCKSMMAVVYLTPSHLNSFLITSMNLGSTVRSTIVLLKPIWKNLCDDYIKKRDDILYTQKYPEKPRNTRKCPRVKRYPKIPDHIIQHSCPTWTRPATRYFVQYLTPPNILKTLPVGHCLSSKSN